MIIRHFTNKDSLPIARLIVKTFKKFNGQDFFDQTAVKKYVDTFDVSHNSEAQLKKIFQSSAIFYVAEDKGNIVGMIRGKKDKISNLFVDAHYQRKGIGRQLVSRFEQAAQEMGGDEIFVKSTLYAAPFYEKMGYVKASSIINYLGLKVYLMKKKIV
jgi:ribosomal protein S18 acetylase RimI-like enzyme